VSVTVGAFSTAQGGHISMMFGSGDANEQLLARIAMGVSTKSDADEVALIIGQHAALRLFVAEVAVCCGDSGFRDRAVKLMLDANKKTA
jgi:hypothetical protein